MPGWGMVASLSGHRCWPKKNDARGRDRTGAGARRNLPPNIYLF